jgi:hypothetical protein
LLFYSTSITRVKKKREKLTMEASGVPYHHYMARPQVVDGGDGIQIWRVAANILNKQ